MTNIAKNKRFVDPFESQLNALNWEIFFQANSCENVTNVGKLWPGQEK